MQCHRLVASVVPYISIVGLLRCLLFLYGIAWYTSIVGKIKSPKKVVGPGKERAMKLNECAIKMERETQSHYERLSNMVSNDELKRLFSLIASVKLEHINRLTALEEKSDETGKVDVDESLCSYSPYIGPWRLAEALKDDADGYRHLEQEEKSMIEFFEELGSRTEDDEVKKICRIQADKEREHLETLERIYSFVEEPRTYLEWGEFSNLKSL